MYLFYDVGIIAIIKRESVKKNLMYELWIFTCYMDPTTVGVYANLALVCIHIAITSLHIQITP